MADIFHIFGCHLYSLFNTHKAHHPKITNKMLSLVEAASFVILSLIIAFFIYTKLVRVAHCKLCP